ncbi:hypothetical protein LZ30DRAFT_729264 [Colletotrichum cereale]|nr:hypothetical protein LZ30DRAFT_729264 [Colletotrichum cereale]
MSPNPAIISAAQGTVRDAFEELEKVISPKDSEAFQSTTLDDVKEAALKIEKQLSAKLLSRNMRRLDSLFKGLEAYHKPLEVLCNGTPYLPWIWAPIKLILQISADYLEAFEEILRAYARVGESLSRFDRFRVAFAQNTLFQQSLANFLSQLVAFHKEVYKFLRKGSWKRFFSTSWNRFRRRFDHIIKELDHQADLVDREASSHSITAVESIRQDLQQWRTTRLEKLAEDEKQSTLRQFQSVMSWLKADSVISEQENIIDAITEEPRKYPSTSSWIMKSSSLVHWLQDRPERPIIWLQGKAGSGKSVIATQVTKFLSTDRNSVVVRHFCSYAHQESLQYDRILTSFISQILRHKNLDSDLIGFVYDDCIVGKKFATFKTLEALITTLLHAITPKAGKYVAIRIILDGLDECHQSTQGKLLSLIKQIVSIQPEEKRSTVFGTAAIKVLVSCRDSAYLASSLRNYPTLSLYTEDRYVKAEINAYVSQRLRENTERLTDWDFNSDEVSRLVSLISERSNGMFLWARLVLDYLDSEIYYHKDDIYRAIEGVPSKLSDFYKRILNKITKGLEPQSIRRMVTSLAWIAFSYRPIRLCELQSALAFTPGTQEFNGVPPKRVIEPFKLLVEEKPGSVLAFIHFSVVEFLKGEGSDGFLTEKDAALEQAVTCLACVRAGLIAFSPSHSDPHTSPISRILRGVFAFYPYAQANWTEHILNAVGRNREHKGQLPGVNGQEMIRLGTELAQMCQAMYGPCSSPVEVKSSSRDQLAVLVQHPDLWAIVKKERQARANWDQILRGSGRLPLPYYNH